MAASATLISARRRLISLVDLPSFFALPVESEDAGEDDGGTARGDEDMLRGDDVAGCADCAFWDAGVARCMRAWRESLVAAAVCDVEGEEDDVGRGPSSM